MRRPAVTEYLAECLWPGVTEAQLTAVDRRVRTNETGSGGAVHYLGTVLMPRDEVVFFVFTGPSASAVRRRHERRDPFRAHRRVGPNTQPIRKEGAPMRAMTPLVAVVVAVVAVVAAAPAAAMTQASTASARAADAKSWCNAVIDTNTKAGAMKNKRYIPVSSITPSVWKKIVDAAVAGGERFIALAPSSIKTATKHEIAYFRHIKANHYSKTTPLAPWTLAEVKQINTFQRTQCGITFGG
jgi:hypothetical protein